MPKYIYRIDRIKLSEKEKRERAKVYNEWNPDNPINIEEFVAKDIYEDTVLFECMDCHKKERYDFEDVKEFFGKDENLIPFCKCPHCKNGVMIPEEIREKI